MEGNKDRLSPYLSPAAVLSLSIGTSIGWGAFVVTSSNYIMRAGLYGSITGLILGAIVMLLIARNYGYLMNEFPSAGGVFHYSAKILGYDYAFLSAWFLGLTYIAIYWANATSIPLFFRVIFNNVLCVGLHYTLFGYEVYLTEVFVTIFFIMLFGLVCCKSRRAVALVMKILASVFTAGILICYFLVMYKKNAGGIRYEESFSLDYKALTNILTIASISPWAFIGFESVSHCSEELDFPAEKIRGVLRISVILTTVLYLAVFMISASTYPPEYDSFLSYIKDMGNLSGLKSVPVFYAANYYLGSRGVFILVLTLFSLIVTSLIGNLLALTRLIYSLSTDGVITPYFSKISCRGIPCNANRMLVLISILIPFMGRTAIGWIVDVTTIGASVIYILVSYMTFRQAKINHARMEIFTGLAGTIAVLFFGVYIIFRGFFAGQSITTESYSLFCIWALVGFVFFHMVLKNDSSNRFGKSVVVWVVLVTLILVLSLIWMIETDRTSTINHINEIHEYIHEITGIEEHIPGMEEFLNRSLFNIYDGNVKSSFIVTLFFGFSIAMLISNFFIMKRREYEHEIELGKARRIANTDPLTGVKSKHAYLEYESVQDGLIEAGELKSVAVAVCDVNNLKYVNDNIGHKAGDAHICAAVKIICNVFAHSPVFRIGGDEFVVVLKDRDYENRAKILAEITAISEKNNKEGKVVIAVGIADFDPSTDKSLLSVFEKADSKMYERKRTLKKTEVLPKVEQDIS